MFEISEIRDGAYVCINNRLIVHSSFKAVDLMNLARELHRVDAKYIAVFEVKSFVTYYGLEESMVSLINQMPVGNQISITEADIIKVEKHLCVGIMKEVEYCYNDEAEQPVNEYHDEVCEEDILLVN